MGLLAQTRVTVPAQSVVYEIPWWQVVAAGGTVFLLLVLAAAFIVVAVAGFRRDKQNIED
jgi:hypothetical protein